MYKLVLSIVAIVLFWSCSSNQNKGLKVQDMEFNDVHSCAKIEEAVTKHLDLDLVVDFENKIIEGVADYIIDNKTGTDHIFFDTKNLDIKAVKVDGQANANYELGEDKGFLGQRLKVFIQPSSKRVSISYKTSPGAQALQWIDARKTAGQKHPFLYTQSQAILARTWIPCQDGPGVRISYNAKVKVPQDLMAVMSASNVTTTNENGVYFFEMKQAVPSY